jgi:hypothetical protein
VAFHWTVQYVQSRGYSTVVRLKQNLVATDQTLVAMHVMCDV